MRSGTQRRLASLSATLKDEVGPIRATAHWLSWPMGRNDLVCHEIERSVLLGAPPARPEAGTAPWAPCDLQHFVPRYREMQRICQKSKIGTGTREATIRAWRTNGCYSFRTPLQSFLYISNFLSAKLYTKILTTTWTINKFVYQKLHIFSNFEHFVCFNQR